MISVVVSILGVLIIWCRHLTCAGDVEIFAWVYLIWILCFPAPGEEKRHSMRWSNNKTLIIIFCFAREVHM
jgi:hypothetical protein